MPRRFFVFRHGPYISRDAVGVASLASKDRVLGDASGCRCVGRPQRLFDLQGVWADDKDGTPVGQIQGGCVVWHPSFNCRPTKLHETPGGVEMEMEGRIYTATVHWGPETKLHWNDGEAAGSDGSSMIGGMSALGLWVIWATKRCFVKLALVVTSFAVLRAGFVQGLGWDQSRPVKVCTRVRERSFGHESDRVARKLTVKIKAAKSSNELIRLLDTATEDSYFNHFHASAAYHKLARFHRSRSFTQANDLVLVKLHSRVQCMVERNELDEQGSANVLWGLAKLLDARPEALKLIRSLAS
eukprot:s2676_g4.t1